MAFCIDGTLGANLSRIDDTPAFKPGIQLSADDSHDYIYVQAAAAIAASTVVVVTEPAFTAAAGAGAWTTVAGQAPAINQYFWAKRVAL